MAKKNKIEHFIGELVHHNGAWGIGWIVEKYKASPNKNAPWNYDIEWCGKDEPFSDGGFTSRGYTASTVEYFKELLQRVQNGENISAQGW